MEEPLFPVSHRVHDVAGGGQAEKETRSTDVETSPLDRARTTEGVTEEKANHGRKNRPV